MHMTARMSTSRSNARSVSFVQCVSIILLVCKSSTTVINTTRLCLLVDPVEVGWLPAVDLLLLEPEVDLLLGAVDGVGAVADVSADILPSFVSSCCP